MSDAPKREDFVTQPDFLDLLVSLKAIQAGDWVMVGTSEDVPTDFPDMVMEFHKQGGPWAQVVMGHHELAKADQAGGYCCAIAGKGHEGKWWIKRYYLAGWIRLHINKEKG
jgi:hypothetical protein